MDIYLTRKWFNLQVQDYCMVWLGEPKFLKTDHVIGWVPGASQIGVQTVLDRDDVILIFGDKAWPKDGMTCMVITVDIALIQKHTSPIVVDTTISE